MLVTFKVCLSALARAGKNRQFKRLELGKHLIVFVLRCFKLKILRFMHRYFFQIALSHQKCSWEETGSGEETHRRKMPILQRGIFNTEGQFSLTHKGDRIARLNICKSKFNIMSNVVTLSITIIPKNQQSSGANSRMLYKIYSEDFIIQTLWTGIYTYETLTQAHLGSSQGIQAVPVQDLPSEILSRRPPRK